jgi:hypothetical protein
MGRGTIIAVRRLVTRLIQQLDGAIVVLRDPYPSRVKVGETETPNHFALTRALVQSDRTIHVLLEARA